VVLQETGIKPDTLRAWERRYGLPQPDRTAGVHRLYSQKDIQMIHWLMTRQQEGLSISRAVKLWGSLKEEGQDPLESMPLATLDFSTPQAIELPPNSTLVAYRENWVNACLNFDEITAESVAAQAFAIYAPETVCFDVLLAGLAEIGISWYQGIASVQQEHFASNLVERRLNALIAASPMPTRQTTILIGCPPGENHTLAPQMITLMLRQRGWKVVYLGANVPIERFQSTIETIKPQLLVLTAQRLQTAASLADVIESVTGNGIPVAYGGTVFNHIPELQKSVQGYYLGSQLRNAAQAIEQLLATSSTTQKRSHSMGENITGLQDTLAHFHQVRAAIENEVCISFQESQIPYAYLEIANQQISKDIDAALRLGSLEFIGYDLGWLKQLMENHNISPVGLKTYIQAYYFAAKTHMDERGAPIVSWLTDLLERNGFT
jgi:methanogenic corrinoid protein MtbC1